MTDKTIPLLVSAYPLARSTLLLLVVAGVILGCEDERPEAKADGDTSVVETSPRPEEKLVPRSEELFRHLKDGPAVALLERTWLFRDGMRPILKKREGRREDLLNEYKEKEAKEYERTGGRSAFGELPALLKHRHRMTVVGTEATDATIGGPGIVEHVRLHFDSPDDSPLDHTGLIKQTALDVYFTADGLYFRYGTKESIEYWDAPPKIVACVWEGKGEKQLFWSEWPQAVRVVVIGGTGPYMATVLLNKQTIAEGTISEKPLYLTSPLDVPSRPIVKVVDQTGATDTVIMSLQGPPGARKWAGVREPWLELQWASPPVGEAALGAHAMFPMDSADATQMMPGPTSAPIRQ